MRKKRSILPLAAPSRTGVTQNGAQARADLRDFERRVVAAIVDVQALAQAALVQRGLEAREQRLSVVVREEFAMADDTAGVVQECDELGLHLADPLLHVGAYHGVGLPELV